MANSLSSNIRRIVSKLGTTITAQDAVDAFWDRCRPDVKANMGESQVEHVEREVREAFREHQKATGRIALDMVA